MKKITRESLLILALLVLGAGVAKADVVSDHSANMEPLPQLFTPNAAELGKYGKIPVNYYSGLPDINIPLAELKVKGGSLPLRLSYHAGGNKPDHHPGWVGLGWSLHGGGCITRIVNGLKDEMTASEFAYHNDFFPNHDPGYLFRAQNVQSTEWEGTDVLENYCQHDVYFDKTYPDTSPDEFMICAEGLNASFYITGENEVRIKSRQQGTIKVDYVLDATQHNIPMGDINYNVREYARFQSFSVTKDDGTVYVFGRDEAAIEYSYDYVGGVYIASANTWNMVEIRYPNGEVVTMDYEHDGRPVVRTDSHNAYTLVSKDRYHSGRNLTFDSKIYGDFLWENRPDSVNVRYTMLIPSYLKELRSAVAKDTIRFHRSATSELRYNVHYRKLALKYLATLTPGVQDSLARKDYYRKLDRIECKNGIDIRLSYTNNGSERLKLQSVLFYGKGSYTPTHFYSLLYNPLKLPAYCSKSTDHWGYYNGKSSFDNLAYSSMESYRTADSTYMQAEMLTRVTYPTGGYTEYEYEPHSYGRRVLYTEDNASGGALSLHDELSDAMAGGLRVRRIRDFDGENFTERSFEYKTAEGRSSGTLSGKHIYVREGDINQTVSFEWGYNNVVITNFYYYIVSSEGALNQLSATDGNHITYRRVTEVFGEGNRNVYEYTDHDEYPDELPLISAKSFESLDILNPVTSRALYRGHLKRTSYYDNEGNIRYDATFRYADDDDYIYSIDYSSACRNYLQRLSVNKIYTGFPALVEKRELVYPDEASLGPLPTTTLTSYNTELRLPVEESRIDGNGNIRTRKTRYSGEISSGVYQAMRSSGMLSFPVEEVEISNGIVTGAVLREYVRNGQNGSYVVSGVRRAELPLGVGADNFTLYDGLTADSRYKGYENRFLLYDANNNLLLSQARDSSYRSYRWSSGGCDLSAVAENGRMYEYGILRHSYSSTSNSFALGSGTASPSGRILSCGTCNLKIKLVCANNIYGSVSFSVDGVQYSLARTSGDYNVIALADIPVEEGEHRLMINAVSLNGGSSGSAFAALLYEYVAKVSYTEVMAPNVYFEDFEDVASAVSDASGNHCYIGQLQVGNSLESGDGFMLEYDVLYGNDWRHVRRAQAAMPVTINEGSRAIDNIRIYPRAKVRMQNASYKSLVGISSFTDEYGESKFFQYDKACRLSAVQDHNGKCEESFSYHYCFDNPGGTNTVSHSVYASPDETSPIVTATYFDGLGRKNRVVECLSDHNAYDIASRIQYDANGRKWREWLPASGRYNSAETAYDDQRPFTEHSYSGASLDRTAKVSGPGADWNDNGRAVRFRYLANDSAVDSLCCNRYSGGWSGLYFFLKKETSGYADSSLNVVWEEDEDGRAKLTFTDFCGRTLLVRDIVRDGGNVEYNDTYYVYDSKNRLIAVLPPLLSEYINNSGLNIWASINTSQILQYAFLYDYDSRDRMILEYCPGASLVYYCYDSADRVVLSQDGNQRAAGKACFHLYDKLGRLCVEGLCNKPGLSKGASVSRIVSAEYKGAAGGLGGYVLQGMNLSSPQILSIKYYDSYAFTDDFANSLPTSDNAFGNANELPEGRLTGERKAVLGDASGNALRMSAYSYDIFGRVIHSETETGDGGYDLTDTEYSFTGKPLHISSRHRYSSASGSFTEDTWYSYDNRERLLQTRHSMNGGEPVVVASNSYDSFGRLAGIERAGNTNLSTGYEYNVRSWVGSISGPLFREDIYYNTLRPGDNEDSHKLFSGNIGSVVWQMPGDSAEQSYTYSYNGSGRLCSAEYAPASASKNFSTSYSYDKNGNVTSLIRRQGGIVDNLSFSYSGNRLAAMENSAPGAVGTRNNVSQQVEYDYDTNGNMTSDQNRGLTITYNAVNCPMTVSGNGILESYLYLADGTKVQRSVARDGNTRVTKYKGNVVYENGSLRYLLFDGGMVEFSGTTSRYLFFLKDHLGNNRVVATVSGEVLQQNNYYPFGKQFNTSTSPADIPFKFSGKEYYSENGMYDFAARQYDPELCRFTSADPLANKYFSISPYAYCNNNPVIFVDPDGKFFETLWDISNVAMDVKSLYDNLSAGKIGAALVDGVSLALDAASVVLPGIPGGIGASVKAIRGVDKAADIAKTVDHATDAVKSV